VDVLDNFIPEPNSGCWLWLGAVLPRSGYGLVNIIDDEGKKTTEVAHRYFYRKLKGPIPSGKRLLHRCDTRSCVNLDHLFVGTQKENVRDCIQKDRRAKECGEDWSTSKLTWDQVQEVRASSESYSSLARKFGVYPNTIKNIKNNLSWKWKNKEQINVSR
jgi:hypothetical protein